MDALKKSCSNAAPRNPKDCFQIHQKLLNLNNTSNKGIEIKVPSLLKAFKNTFYPGKNQGNGTNRFSGLNDKVLELQCLPVKSPDQLRILKSLKLSEP